MTGKPIEMAGSVPLTAESANFPHLFPDGVGMFQQIGASSSLVNYLRYRMACAFSPFTMYKPYLLVSIYIITFHSVTLEPNGCYYKSAI